MSADNDVDEPFFSNVTLQELLSVLDELTDDESQPENEARRVEETQQLNLHAISSAAELSDLSDIALDPYNFQHVQLMQQFVALQCGNNDAHQHCNSENRAQQPPTTKAEKLEADDSTATDSIDIDKHEYSNISDFNHKLQAIILNAIRYAETNGDLYRMHQIGNQRRPKHASYRTSSYDGIMRHIPPHSHYAFNNAAMLSAADSFTEGISQKHVKSKMFRSPLMKHEDLEIMQPTLTHLRIDHSVNVESLKLIHDIVQLNKASLKSISFHFKLYNEAEPETKAIAMDEKYRDDDDDGHDDTETAEQREVHRAFLRLWQQQKHAKKTKPASEHEALPSNHRKRGKSMRYESNMMISCISSILKLCERMSELERFDFCVVDFKQRYYDYFTYFDINSDRVIFPNLKYLSLYIDDSLSKTEVASFPFYAFSGSPILAFLKKLVSLQSISIVIDGEATQNFDDDEEDEENRHARLQEQQFQIYWIKKLCEKIIEILNKNHSNLQEFHLKNIRSDCGKSEFFMEMMVQFIKHHALLTKFHLILNDLCDEHLANLVQAMYYTDSKMKYKSCINNIEDVKFVSETCIDNEYASDPASEHRVDVASLRYHYGDASLSALLHLVYNCKTLRSLSLVCFYGADTIKFNALISAIKLTNTISYLQIAQLRKDSDTLYSLCKLFKPIHHKTSHHHHHHKRLRQYNLSWSVYEHVDISFGVEFRHFYHGEKVDMYEMHKFIDLIVQSQVLHQRNKVTLLELLSSRRDKEAAMKDIPNEILWIVVECSLGADGFTVQLLQWNLFDAEELWLLYHALKYFKRKYRELMAEESHIVGIKHLQRQIQWFDSKWHGKIGKIY